MNASDWEIVSEDNQKLNQKDFNSSEWEIVPKEKSLSQNKENFGYSVLAAIPRILSDVGKGAYGFANKIPGYLESAKTEVPGILGTLKDHPAHAGLQALAGSQELINKLAQFPLNAARYGANRLNLLPQSVPNAIEKISPPDTTQAISQLFGEPKYPGEALIRGSVRDIPELFGAGKLAQFMNPLKYTSKNIAKDILKEGENQSRIHKDMYNNLWSDAKHEGFDKVPVNNSLLSNNLETIKKYKTPREYKSLEDFISEPTISNAQKAQSDMNGIARSLSKKSRSSSLTSEENAMYQAAINSEKHIENNMFKNNKGEVNQPLKDRYDEITKSYRENVVPYKYNPDIQAFKNQEILSKQLKQRLSLGDFAAKKGSEHPELFRGDLIRKALIGLGAVAGGKSLYDYFSHENVPNYIYGK